MTLERELARSLGDGTLVFCVGSGPSIAAGLPDLDALARGLLARAREFDPSLDAAGLGQWIDQGRGAEVLEQLQHRMGAEFQREVERALSDQGRSLPPVVRALAKLRKQLRAIYTTRLDRLVERGLEGRWPTFSAARPDLAQRRGLVFKLRGTLEFPQSWVLTREQEEREFGPGSPRREVFEAAFAAHVLAFIGFRVGSHELRRLLDMLPASAGQGPSHYIVLPACEGLEREQLERRGLRVVIADDEALLASLGGAAEAEAKLAASAASCPYPGLEAFSEDQASVFFGRHAEVSQATSLLGGLGGVDHRWLAIEGPSGVGKSSFARAGVIPALRQGFAEGTPGQWFVATMRPGTSPLANLAKAVCEALRIDALASELEQLRASPRWLAELLRRRVGPGQGFALLIDQLEEAVTLAPEAERAAFGELIARALDARVLYLITTTRSDLIPALQRDLPSLAGLLNDVAQRYALPPISRVGLREAICEPALRQGVTMAPDLVERILVDADEGQSRASTDKTRTADATLPLVAHILRGLWTDQNVADGVITLDEYLGLGGIAGALSRSADTLVDALGDRPDVRELFLRLIRLQPDGTVTRRVLGLDEGRQVSDDQVLGLLSGAEGSSGSGPRARLIIIREGADQQEVELVHEALIRDWGRLSAWIEQNRAQLEIDDELGRRAARWQAQGSARADLPTGKDVISLLAARPHGNAGQRQQQQAFQAALRSRRSRRRWILGGVGAGVVGLVVAAAFMITFDADTCSINIEGGPKISKAATLSGTGDVALATAVPHTTIIYRCEANEALLGGKVGALGRGSSVAMITLPLALALPRADEAVTVIAELEDGEVRHFEDLHANTQVEFEASKVGLPSGMSVTQLEQLGEIMPSAPEVSGALAQAQKAESSPSATTTTTLAAAADQGTSAALDAATTGPSSGAADGTGAGETDGTSGSDSGSDTGGLITVFDAAASFSAQTPNGVWSYGLGTIGGDFTAAPNCGVMPDELAQVDYCRGSEEEHGIFHNQSDQAVDGSDIEFGPHALLMLPGGGNDHLVKLRFTAPADDCYAVDVQWRSLHPDATLAWAWVHGNAVSVGGTGQDSSAGFRELFTRGLSGFGDIASFTDTITLAAGEILSFEAGQGGDGAEHDALRIDLIITRTGC